MNNQAQAMAASVFVGLVAMAASAGATPPHQHIWEGGCLYIAGETTYWIGDLGENGCAEHCQKQNYKYFMLAPGNCLCAHNCITQSLPGYHAYAVGDWIEGELLYRHRHPCSATWLTI